MWSGILGQADSPGIEVQLWVISWQFKSPRREEQGTQTGKGAVIAKRQVEPIGAHF